jgi:hypothetical protein
VSRIVIRGDEVNITLNILETILTFHRHITIPLSNIHRVSAEPVNHVWWRGIRLPIGVPGTSHGTFRTVEGKVFASYRNNQRCISLELNHNKRYRYVIVEIDAPQDKNQVKETIERAATRIRHRGQ